MMRAEAKPTKKKEAWSMKKQWKGFVCGFMAAILVVVMGTTALAATVRQLNASYSGIKISLDGVEFVPKDANGTVVEPFIVDGTTYLPVRAVASAFGLDVAWDGATQTVILTTPKKEAQEIILSSGNYIAGTDFPAGTYDIVAISGGGNVQSSNMFNGGINAIMGDDSYIAEYGDFYEKEYKNIRLPDGTELRVFNGVTIQLIPKN